MIHFSKDENWGNFERMDPALLEELDLWRAYVGKPVHINRGYVEGDPRTHGQGLAVDCHIKGMPVMDQFLFAQRFKFGGIGVYPYWNNPGLHLDMRSARITSIWGQNKYGTYANLSWEWINNNCR